MRFPIRALVLVAAAAAPWTALAEDDTATQNAKTAVSQFDKHLGSASKDYTKYANLVTDLASQKHPLAIERIGRILARDPDVEHKLIAASTLGDFRAPEALRNVAGKVLVDHLIKGDRDPEVDEGVVLAIGRIAYRDAVPQLNELMLGGGDPYVLLAAVKASGQIDDRRSLPALLELWERYPKGAKEQEGEEVRVDTGTAGDGDQKAAEAKYKEQNKNSGRPRKPPLMLRVYIQALVKSVKAITDDDTIEEPDHLRAWMEARRDELKAQGVEIPKYKGPKKKDEDDKSGKGGKKDKK